MEKINSTLQEVLDHMRSIPNHIYWQVDTIRVPGGYRYYNNETLKYDTYGMVCKLMTIVRENQGKIIHVNSNPDGKESGKVFVFRAPVLDRTDVRYFKDTDCVGNPIYLWTTSQNDFSHLEEVEYDEIPEDYRTHVSFSYPVDYNLAYMADYKDDVFSKY